MRSRIAPLSLLAIGAVLLVSAAPVEAGKAVSIDVGAIAVREQLVPGGEYHLPTFGVRNPGTEATSYDIAVSYIDGQDALRPPEGWFRFDPVSLTLAAGESRPITTTVEIPADAEPGEYAALIGPQIVGDGTGAQVGAGAAARLTFTIQPSSALDGWLRWLFRFLAENPLVWIGGLLVVLLTFLWVLRRRFSISVTRRPG
jgi:NPCBM-associated, NEW3 domain of alpha-galactosidase